MDAAFIKQSFASAVIGVVIEKLASILDVGPFKKRNLNHGSRQKLRIVLLSAEAELIEARAKQITNPAVKKWLGLLNDAVDEAKELLDKIDRTEDESQTRKRKYSDFSSGFVNLFGKGFESELQEVLERLEYMTEHKDLPGLRVVAGEVPIQQFASCSVEESHVYGRYCDVEEIFKIWQSDGQAICVLPIVGIGGIGKTTLARMVYEDSRVKESFDLKAWVCVSVFFDSFMILKTILEQISWFTCDTQNLSSLQTKIRKTLKGKKFLLILDNAWNEDYNDWVELLKVFECVAQEIKILVTTRSFMVASKVCSVRSPSYVLNELSHDCCWALFAQHAFGNGKHHEFEELEEIGRMIVSKCKGLPLAAKLLGCLLGSNKSRTYWFKVLEHHIWSLSIYETNIFPALNLSYYYLPPHLKQCFAYCSTFPYNYEFKKEELILLWMREGFVDYSIENRSLEIKVIAEGYFNDLLSRSFFTRSNNSESRFVMHDLVRNLAKSMAHCSLGDGE